MTASKKPNKPTLKIEIERYGLTEALLGRFLKAIKRFVVVFRISSRPLGDGFSEECSIERECRLLTEEEIRDLPSYMPDQITEQFVESALARGDTCVGAIIENKVVAFTWRSYTTAPHTDGLWVRFQPPYRYGYKAFVVPEYRGKRIMQAGTGDDYCTSHGYNAAIAFIERDNLPSLHRTNRRDNNKIIGYIFMLKLFGKRFLFSTKGVKQVGFEFYEHPTDD